MTAAVLAMLPALVGIAVVIVSRGRFACSFVYGGLGMNYVGRWMKASLILLIFDVAAFVAFKVDPLLGLLVAVLEVLFELIALPIWAVKAVREYNQLADILEAPPAGSVRT